MEKRFDEFSSVSLSEFEAQLVKDLRGKPLEFLTNSPEDGIEVTAYSHKEHNIAPNNLAGLRPSKGWVIRKEISADTGNKTVLEYLNAGVTGLGLHSLENLSSQNKDVLFQHIYADLKLDAKSAAGHHEINENIHLIFDPIADAMLDGEDLVDLDNFVNYVSRYDNHNSISVDGSIYGNAGATSIQELGMSLAHFNEYLNALTKGKDDASIAPLIQKSVLNLSVTENYFVNIAKFRALRILLKSLFEGYDYTGGIQPKIGAKTSSRTYAVNDANNNLLRATTQGMSAVLGGCDVLTVNTEKLDDTELNSIHERIGKNISLVLQEEAHLDKVDDPGAGSYYIEKITNILVEEGWKLFLSIEEEGGLIASMNAGNIHTSIKESADKLIERLNTAKITLLGINKFQNSMEEYKTIKPLEATGKALLPLKLEAHYSSVEA